MPIGDFQIKDNAFKNILKYTVVSCQVMTFEII